MPQAFPETLWSQLIELHDRESPRRAEILERLMRRYWKPVYQFVRSFRRSNQQDAEDLTQQFFATLLHRGDLHRISPERGSFRGFLGTALRNFLIGADRVSLVVKHAMPFDEAEMEWLRDPAADPETAFARAWARDVMSRALAELARQLRDEGREQQLAIFESYCLGTEEVSYRELAERHGLREDDVRNRLREVRLRLRKILARIVGEYLGPGQSVERS